MTGAGAHRPTTSALGGTRQVPVPDPIAREFLLLALRLDQHVPGLVDAYLGPADLKAQVDMEQLRAPSRLAEDARELMARVAGEVAERDRRAWLTAQLGALETQARWRAGASVNYLDRVTGFFDWRPSPWPDRIFQEAAAELERLVPGRGSIAERLEAWDARLTLQPDGVAAVADWLVDGLRSRARLAFGLPAGEQVRVRLVSGQPWSGYNWYEGGLRSRVEINTDLPVRAPDLLRVLAHETYPGHHLEHSSKEQELITRLGRMECSIQLINTPECLMSEGLADVGYRFAVPPEREADLLAEFFERAGPPLAADRLEARELAATAAALRPWRRRLDAARLNAAILRHVEGRSREDVIDYLVNVGCFDAGRAAQRADFIEHPLWQHYVFVYHEGETLLERWLDQVDLADQPARFARLLREPLTPSAIASGLEEVSPTPD